MDIFARPPCQAAPVRSRRAPPRAETPARGLSRLRGICDRVAVGYGGVVDLRYRRCALLTANLKQLIERSPQPEGVPKYVHFSDLITRLIENETLKPGDKLPSETALAAALPVSLGTVQKALTLLSQRRIISRRLGHGTFVEPRRAILREHEVYRFIGDDRAHALPVFTNVTAIDRVDAPGLWSEFLGADKYYIRISRTIDVGGEFRVAARFYLRGPEFEDILSVQPSALNGRHLGLFIRETFGVSTQGVVERLLCGELPPDVCAEIGRPCGHIGMIRNIRAYRDRNRPLSFQNVYVPQTDRELELPTTR